MIYVMPEFVIQKLGIKSCPKTDSGLIELFDRVKDHIIAIDNIQNQIAFFNYAKLEFKFVISIPDYSSPYEVLTLDKEHVISYNEFLDIKQEYSKNIQQEAEAKALADDIQFLDDIKGDEDESQI